MTTFKIPTTKPTLSILSVCAPEVYVSSEALTKMQLLVDKCGEEVGWLGTATKHDTKNIYYIHDVYVFDQDVHSTTTEITPEGLAEFGEALLMQPNGMDIWNNLKVWGHSHVNMATSPSGQDNSQMEFFSKSGHDWFIRIIANKNGSLRVDLYDFNVGIIYNELQWEDVISKEEQELHKQIAIINKQIEELNKVKLAHFDSFITSEIKDKVHKKTYAQSTIGFSSYRSAYGQNGYLSAYGGVDDDNYDHRTGKVWFNGRWVEPETVNNEPPSEKKNQTATAK